MGDKEVKEKEEIKKILVNHLNNLSKISDSATKSDEVLLYVVSEAMKTTVFTLLFFDKI